MLKKKKPSSALLCVILPTLTRAPPAGIGGTGESGRVTKSSEILNLVTLFIIRIGSIVSVDIAIKFTSKTPSISPVKYLLFTAAIQNTAGNRQSNVHRKELKNVS